MRLKHDLQRDPAFKRTLFKNESKVISYIMRPFSCVSGAAFLYVLQVLDCV